MNHMSNFSMSILLKNPYVAKNPKAKQKLIQMFQNGDSEHGEKQEAMPDANSMILDRLDKIEKLLTAKKKRRLLNESDSERHSAGSECISCRTDETLQC